VAALGLALGCATKPPSQRSWVEVQTPHFRILSALSRSATTQLARDLDLFRRAVELLAAGSLPAVQRRSLVFAFDDRRPSRSFAAGAQSAYLLSSLDGLQLVLRGGGGWRGDAGEALRHDLAHALLRGRDGLDAPLWYDEGIAQLASTIEVGDRSSRIGGLRSDQLGRLRDGPRIPVRALLRVEGFDATGGPRRRDFEAESFAFAHYLCLGVRAPRHAPARLRELAATHDPDDATLERLLGLSARELDRELRGYPSRAQAGALELRAGGGTASPPRSRPLARSEVLVELGELALDLGRSDLARSHFEAGLASRAQAARVRAGLAGVLALEGDRTRAIDRLEEALALAPRDARIQRRAGDLWLLRARQASAPEERRRHAERARRHYGRSLDRDRHQAGAHAGIAASRLAEGRGLAAGLAELERAQRLNPGSHGLRVLRARLLSASGDVEAAGRLARALRARLHGGADLRNPTELSIEASVSRDGPEALRRSRAVRPGHRAPAAAGPPS
jgi:Tfp pilus assembly protein PilF